MVRQMLKSTTATLPEAIRMASLTPAERTGIAHDSGSLEKNKRADILVLNSRLELMRIFIGGQEHLHRSSSLSQESPELTPRTTSTGRSGPKSRKRR